MKTFSYAYPTSDKAKELGFYKTGCFYITVRELDGEVVRFSYESAKACLKFWDTLDEEITKYSFFGIRDNDKNRRERYES